MGNIIDFNSRAKGCETCSNCIPIGEGDFICTEFSNSKMVISDYEHTDEYNACEGTMHEKW